MTKTHYKSKDQIIEIVTTTDDNRYPRHDAPMAVVKLRPRDHTRCRSQWGGVTVMFTYAELRALAEAIAACDPSFTFTMAKSARNKPEPRRLWWKRWNVNRSSGKNAHARR